MSKFSEYLKKDATYHLFVWFLLIVPHGMFSYFMVERGGWFLFWLNLAIVDGVLLIILYLNIFYFIRKFYRPGKYVTYFILLATISAGYIFLVVNWEEFVAKQLGFNETRSLYFSSLFNLFNIARYLVLSFLLYKLQEQYDQNKLMDQIRLEKLQTEINYLRAQINPHFLFNTLNNIYGLALEKSERTPEVILKLSKMMDYMLYELDGTKIHLKKDIENLENYIALERIRLGNNASITFDKQGSIDNQKIEPLLLLPIVENAFKHGVHKQMEGAYLSIQLITSQHQLHFRVENNYKTIPVEPAQAHTGIGLANLKKRLELFYPGVHKLMMDDRQNRYTVELQLTL